MRICLLHFILRLFHSASHLLSNEKGNGQVTALTAGTVVAIGLTGAGVVATKYVTDRQKEINQAEQIKLNEDAARKLKDKITLRKDNASGLWTAAWEVKITGCPGGAAPCLSGPDIGTSSQISITPTTVRNLNSVDVSKLFTEMGTSTQDLINTANSTNGAPVNFRITGYQAPQGGVKGWVTAQTEDGMIAEISLDALPNPPTCEIASQRVGVSDQCTVTLTAEGERYAGPYSGFNPLPDTNTRTCSVSSSTTFTATVTGVGGSCTKTATQDKVKDPQCGQFNVTRTSPTSDQCQVTLSAIDPQLVAQPPNGILVNGLPLAPSYTCPKYSPTQFTASLKGVNGTVVSCGQKAPLEAEPTCTSLTVARKDNEPGKCLVSMVSQGNVTERWINNLPQPGAGPWTLNCPTLSSVAFTGKIRSAGGEAACATQSVQAVPPTSCTFTASRINSDRCRVTVTSTGGPMSGDYPRLGYRSDSFGPYSRSENPWQPEQSLFLNNRVASLDVGCDSLRTHYFATVGFGPGDTQRKNCTSSDPGHIGGGVVRILPPASQCRFTASRDPQSLGICTVRVSRQGGPFNEEFPLISYAREGGSWITQQRLRQWDGTTGAYSTACATNGDFQFVVVAHGPGNPGTYRCTPESKVPSLIVSGNALRVPRVPPPRCSSLIASRLSPTSDQCRLTFNLAANSGPLASPRPVPRVQKDRSLASLSSDLGWSGNTWEGNIHCPTQSAGEFSATITGLSGTSTPCTAPQIAPVPPTQCNFSAARKSGAPGTCVVSVSSTGGPLSAGYPVLKHAIDNSWQSQRAISPWNGSSSSMEVPCDIARTHTLVASVKGPGDNQEKNCSGGNHLGEIGIPPLPPACSNITAQRTAPSSTTCNVTLTKADTSGPISQVLLNNAATAGSWNGNTWTGTTSCASAGASISGTLTSVSGHQSACGTFSISALPPACSNIIASRVTPLAENCTVTITKTDQSGPISQVLVNNQATSGSWNGNTWTGTAYCSSAGASLTGTLTSVSGQQSDCGSSAIAPLLAVCSGITANRTTATSTTCNVTLTKSSTSGPVSQVLVNNQVASGSWNGNTWTGTTSCASSGASISGALTSVSGQQSDCGGPATIEALPPVCLVGMTANRTAPSSTTCNVTLTRADTSGPISQVLLNNVATSGSWNGNTWTGTASCASSGASISGTLTSVSGKQSACGSATVPEVWYTCSIPTTWVGYFASTKWCSTINCWTWMDATLNEGIKLPSDSRNISITAGRVFVDDWSPRISINGHRLIWRDDPTGTASTWHTLNTNISTWLRGGDNVVYVGSYNMHTYWSIFFEISGTYETRGSCSHSVKYQRDNVWQ